MLNTTSNEEDGGIINKYRDVLEDVFNKSEEAGEDPVDEVPQDNKDEEDTEDPLKSVSAMMPDDLQASSSIARLVETLDRYPDKRFLIFSSWYERYRFSCLQMLML